MNDIPNPNQCGSIEMSFTFYNPCKEEALRHFLVFILIEPHSTKSAKICAENLKLQEKRTIPVRFLCLFMSVNMVLGTDCYAKCILQYLKREVR